MNMVTNIVLVSVIVAALAGCAPQGRHYQSMNYMAPYDPIVYTPQDTVRPFYDHNYYRYDTPQRHD